MKIAICTIGVCLLLFGLVGTKAVAQDVKVDWFSLSSGGGMLIGPGTNMIATVAEGFVGGSKGQNTVLTSGFLSAILASGSIVGVSEQPQVPKVFLLHQNYPNPFNPTTTIRFELPHSAKVSLRVYNLLGQEAVTLINEDKPAGVYEVKFNAVNLSSGMYVYRIRAGDFVATKKLILLR